MALNTNENLNIDNFPSEDKKEKPDLKLVEKTNVNNNESLENKETPEDFVYRLINSNEEFKNVFNSDEYTEERQHPAVSGAIMMAKINSGKVDQDVLETMILKNLSSKLDAPKTASKEFKNFNSNKINNAAPEKKVDTSFLNIQNANNYSNQLAKNILEIKASKDASLIGKTTDEINEILESISNLNGETADKTRKKLKSQEEYLLS